MRRAPKRSRLIKQQLRVFLPRAPLSDFQAIETKATAGHLRHLPPSIAAKLAISSHIRHALTEYDQLLSDGYEPDSARFFVIDTMNEILANWGSALKLNVEDDL